MAFITVTESDNRVLLNSDHILTVDVVERDSRFRLRIKTVEGTALLVDPTDREGDVISPQQAMEQGSKVLLGSFRAYLNRS